VQRARDQFLAGAAFALDQHRSACEGATLPSNANSFRIAGEAPIEVAETVRIGVQMWSPFGRQGGAAGRQAGVHRFQGLSAETRRIRTFLHDGVAGLRSSVSPSWICNFSRDDAFSSQKDFQGIGVRLIRLSDDIDGL
jgi:hypothetical protein